MHQKSVRQLGKLEQIHRLGSEGQTLKYSIENEFGHRPESKTGIVLVGAIAFNHDPVAPCGVDVPPSGAESQGPLVEGPSLVRLPRVENAARELLPRPLTVFVLTSGQLNLQVTRRTAVR